MPEHPTQNRSIAAERLGDHGSPQAYGPDRECVQRGCGVRLPICNRAEACALHDVVMTAASPAKAASRSRRRRASVAGPA